MFSKLIGKKTAASGAPSRPQTKYKPLVLSNGQVQMVPTSSGPDTSNVDRIASNKFIFQQARQREWSGDRDLDRHIREHGAQSLQLPKQHHILHTSEVHLPTISSPRLISSVPEEFSWVREKLHALIPQEMLLPIWVAVKDAEIQRGREIGAIKSEKKARAEDAQFSLYDAGQAKTDAMNRLLAHNEIFIQFVYSPREAMADGEPHSALIALFPTTSAEAERWRDEVLPSVRASGPPPDHM